MVIIPRGRRVGDQSAVGRIGIGILGEKEWRFAVVATHFARMGGVVPADAEDTADRKTGIATGNRRDTARTRWKYRLHEPAPAFIERAV